MRWLAKAAVQKILSAIPRGERLNYLLARHLYHGLPHSPEKMVRRFKMAVQYVHAARRLGPLPEGPATAFEFGAGQDLAVPLSLYALGMRSQTLADLRPIADWYLINHAMERYQERWPRLSALAGRPLRPLPREPVHSVDQMRERLGIDYRAPMDARRTGLPGGAFDLVSSCHVLEHIPERMLLPMLRECGRLVSPQGVICHVWNMQDHFADFDPSLSVYNFLTLGDGAWRLVNSGLQYQNRLRLPDYLELFGQAGLEVVHQRVAWPGPEQMERLARLKLAPRFRDRYGLRDLGARLALVVLKKAA
ncbi:MAG: class I SAM-dependent methyltransferase [Desulfarculaceae bacterium]|nr:class I SAM-dependent methyltransferase [Desulfarculaceae bacterium]MCF8073999.1 class I SAM-dependent methyltransferase [Desulfarculaceae bacterium]MCF8102685.1 class I SAM-dependent methyltransferase [Desulfarculaceae bacterium]MCF8116074.1 class I SAM-dependent methyltransferase [Desulfarculaceae bacterium]